MRKKILCFLGIICVLSFITGCKKNNKSDMIIDADVQLSVIENNKDLWTFSDSSVKDCNGYGYAVSDLDMDGYLEIIKSSYGGNGHFSQNSFYEVTENKELKELDSSDLLSSYSQPDLLAMNSLKKIQDSEGWVYFTEDFESWGVYGYANRYGNLSIKNDSIFFEEIAREENTASVDGMEATYYIRENEIAENEYIEWMKQCNDTICFVKLIWFQEISSENLKKSYEEFSNSIE